MTCPRHGYFGLGACGACALEGSFANTRTDAATAARLARERQYGAPRGDSNLESRVVMLENVVQRLLDRVRELEVRLAKQESK